MNGIVITVLSYCLFGIRVSSLFSSAKTCLNIISARIFIYTNGLH